jgi:hypothetical protein
LPICLTTNYDDNMFQALTPRQELARWTQDLLDNVDSSFDCGYKPTPKTLWCFTCMCAGSA